MTQPFQLLMAAMASALLGGTIAWLFLRSRPAALEIRLEERDREVNALRSELVTVRERILAVSKDAGRLAGTLESERASANEKLALLDGAKAQLKEAFAVVSQEALQQNNQSFLDLAQTKLTDFQRSAQTDLDARQQSIDLMVKPVHEVGAEVQGPWGGEWRGD